MAAARGRVRPVHDPIDRTMFLAEKARPMEQGTGNTEWYKSANEVKIRGAAISIVRCETCRIQRVQPVYASVGQGRARCV
jgi:hypothetical protein